MNIGFVSTWFERGAAYVTKAYIDLLKEDNNVFVYARGGEKFEKNDPNWNIPYVTWGLRLNGSDINFNHFKKWINDNKIDTILFNEQKNIDIVLKVKKHMPNVKLGSYIDYYKEDTLEEFNFFDFLICNTKRHYSLFKDHPQAFYVPWGTDNGLFKPSDDKNSNLTFFHSVGMSKRKGTKRLIEAFIEGEIYKSSKLIIHTQINLQKAFGYKQEDLIKYNIEIIEKTVSAPGLYHLGDVYVYPTTLDGLGLTLYEALSAGLPVITTDNPPMNEVIDNNVGYLVKVEKFHSRADGYYWPLSIVEKESLINAMKHFVNSKDNLDQYKDRARTKAVNLYNWSDRKQEINSIFHDSVILYNDVNFEALIKSKSRKNFRTLLRAIVKNTPGILQPLLSKLFFEKVK